MPMINGVIVLENNDEMKFPILVRSDCPSDTIYFLPKGSTTRNLETGETVQLAPGYYVNPRRLGVITGIIEGKP